MKKSKTKSFQKKNNREQKSTKNIRTQCFIENNKVKLPFFNKWNPDTDDEFSDLEF